MPVNEGTGSRDADPAPVLVARIDSYLSDHPGGVVLEDGLVVFELRSTRYSITESHGRCLLQLWNEERNLVRSIVSAEPRGNRLRLMTRKIGVPQPVALELAACADRRTPTMRESGRRQYLRRLERVATQAFPEWKLDGLRAATDLEHSFGPAYARGILLRGTTAEALIAVSSAESSAMIDGVLTLGILWLDFCREQSLHRRSHGTRHFRGLKVIVPLGAWQTTAERMVWLNHTTADFRLFALDERSDELSEIDFRDTGNIDSRLVHAFDVPAAIERAGSGIETIQSLMTPAAWRRVEIRAHSASEIGVLLHGLEFARVRQAASARNFMGKQEVTIGAGLNEITLTAETESMCRTLLECLFLSRQPDGEHVDPLFRLQPERWLESRIRMGIEEFLPGMRGEFLYSQVPAIGAGERGMLDLLTIDQAGRLVVIEVKADEDMHLPLQGLDYWLRVRALNAQRWIEGNRETGAFERQGYFAQGTGSKSRTVAEISPGKPKLLLVAPALRIHPSNEIVLRYLSPDVEWELIAVSEHWRRDLKVVFRKRSS
jgi:hypothetical protein